MPGFFNPIKSTTYRKLLRRGTDGVKKLDSKS
jgi:hypothetical protein